TCTLTREQATLYQATVKTLLEDEGLGEGFSRQGRVLKLLTALKQICNHPAQYLGEPGPLRGRSGKLARATEMLAEVVAAGDRAYRIGQTKTVNVHKLVTGGTLEDRIATMLQEKRALADAVVGTGETWLADLDDDELRALVALSTEDVED